MYCSWIKYTHLTTKYFNEKKSILNVDETLTRVDGNVVNYTSIC